MSKEGFAQSHLQKYGWKEGKGLGRNESGITDAIKPKLKFDTAGIGHDAGEQFSFHWWDHVFNKAAKNIQVQNNEDGVQVKHKEAKSQLISNKKSTHERSKQKAKPLLYGSFVKHGTLKPDGMISQDKSVSSSSSDDSDVEDDGPLDSYEGNDEKLFKACGGRTAHKGARHGLHLSGKLQRIEEQENLHSIQLKTTSNLMSGTSIGSDSRKHDDHRKKMEKRKKKKAKKNKKTDKALLVDDDENKDVEESGEIERSELEQDIKNTEEGLEENMQRIRKKKRNKKKCKSKENEGEEFEKEKEVCVEGENLKKRTKHGEEDNGDQNRLDDWKEKEIEYHRNRKSKKKRKKERKETYYFDATLEGLAPEDQILIKNENGDDTRKKKKKKEVQQEEDESQDGVKVTQVWNASLNDGEKQNSFRKFEDGEDINSKRKRKRRKDQIENLNVEERDEGKSLHENGSDGVKNDGDLYLKKKRKKKDRERKEGS